MISSLLTNSASAVMKIDAPSNPLQPMPVGIKGNFSGNINSTSTSIAPLSSFSDLQEQNDSSVNNQEELNNKVQNQAVNKNTSNNIWYWLILFILLIIAGLVWGFKKLK